MQSCQSVTRFKSIPRSRSSAAVAKVYRGGGGVIAVGIVIGMIGLLSVLFVFFNQSSSVSQYKMVIENVSEKKNNNNTKLYWSRTAAVTTDEDYQWCTDILQHYNLGEEWPELSVAKHGFVSQYKQDWFLFSSMFRSMYESGYVGTYVDLAAHAYKRISNTFFFDKCLSWNGICIEAEPRYTGDLQKYRSCHLIDTCIWSEPKTLIFKSSGSGMSGLEHYNKLAKIGRKSNDIEMECTTLSLVFSGVGVTHIDYMSLDIEGSENFALLGIDFARVQIDVITVEGNDKNVVNTLENNGYLKKMHLHEDFVFVHRNATDKIAAIDHWIENTPWQNAVKLKFSVAHNTAEIMDSNQNVAPSADFIFCSHPWVSRRRSRVGTVTDIYSTLRYQ